METIDWTKYVDAIYCLHYLPYKERKKEIDEELNFVDILHSPIFRYYYTFHNNLDYFVLNTINPSFRDYNNERLDKVLNLNQGYHSIFRECQEFGYDKVLIIEDDVKFVRNKQLLIDTLEHLPKHWDFIQFDKIMNHECNDRLSTLRIGKWFHENYTGGYWGFAFVMVSKKAIDIGVKEYEKNMTVADYLFVNRDDPVLKCLDRFVPSRHLLYQADSRENYFSLVY